MTAPALRSLGSCPGRVPPAESAARCCACTMVGIAPQKTPDALSGASVTSCGPLRLTPAPHNCVWLPPHISVSSVCVAHACACGDESWVVHLHTYRGVHQYQPLVNTLSEQTDEPAEIAEFCRFLEPTPEETAARRVATDRVSGVITAIWPRANVQVWPALSCAYCSCAGQTSKA